MRADARDNRARIMTAADEVFGRSPSASTDDVAKLAGVGIATVFRHFPTKTELLEAVLTLRLERLRDRAVELADSTIPGRGVLRVLHPGGVGVGVEAGDRRGPHRGRPAAGADAQKAGSGLRDAFHTLLTRAQEDGAVRRDAGLAEVYALLIGASRGATAVGLEPEVRDRMLGLIFDGLRPRP